MNYFLMLIILGMGYGGYYEYDLLHTKNLADQKQIDDFGAQVATLTAENAKLEDEAKQLTKSADDAKTEISDVTKQLQDAKTALVQAKQVGTQPAATAGAAPMFVPNGNNLGTIALLDGKSYPNCELMKVQADCIVISYVGGITQVPFSLMAPDLQKRFGFDPQVALALSADQVAVQEMKRKAAAAAQTAGN
jgi:hypothetical protein